MPISHNFIVTNLIVHEKRGVEGRFLIQFSVFKQRRLFIAVESTASKKTR